MKKMDKKAFTLIELIVVIAVIGILVLLGIPRFIGHTQKAELTRIQHDVKVMEQEIGTEFINNDDDINKWENNTKDFNQLIQEGKLFEKEGFAYKEPIDGPYKVIPEKYKDKINTKLKGTFYANSGGKVYYEHTKSLSGIPSESGEKGPEYSDKEIQELIKEGYIPIATADELDNVRNNAERIYGKGTQWERLYTGGLDKKYVQVKNIDLSEYSEEGWAPIGTESASFTGTYDGNGYKIAGLTINRPETDYVGLFGFTKLATISNVGLINNKVTGSCYVGGLVGIADDSTIENSYATGPVTGEDGVGGLVGISDDSTKISNSYATGSVTGRRYVGGLAGFADDSTMIRNSYATGSVTGDEWFVGGLVGRADDSTISNSYATGSVTGSSDVGGLVGWALNSTIENSYATGSVEGTDSVGGLAGYVSDNTEIRNSYATGSVEGTDSVGGLVGLATSKTEIRNSYATGSVTGSGNDIGGLVGWADDNTISNSYATGSVEGTDSVGGLVGYTEDNTISNSYATGSVKGSGNDIGGLAGFADDSTVTSSYWDTLTTGQENSAGGEGKSTEDMKKKETYLNEVSNWDFDTVWEITPGNYPTLR